MKDIFGEMEVPQAVWDKLRTMEIPQAVRDEGHRVMAAAYQTAEDHMKAGPITVESVHNAAEEILSCWRKVQHPIFASTIRRAHSIALVAAIQMVDPEKVIHRDHLGHTKFIAPRSVGAEELLNGYTEAHPKIMFYDSAADIYYL
jgi:hypothetical protein